MNEALTLEELQQLLELGGQNDEASALLNMQKAQANRLRQGNTLQARDTGRVTVPPHWMELVGGLAREKVASDIDKKMEQSSKDQAMRRQQQNALMLRGLMNNQQQRAAPSVDTGLGMMLPNQRSPGVRLPYNQTEDY